MVAVIESAIGLSVESYTVVRELGRGGMGAVYLAESAAGERRAIKILHAHLSHDETTIARFRTEARAASIPHPAIVQSYGLGQLADGRWYCMMEYVDGVTLTQYCAERGPLSLALVLEIIAPLAEALDQIHAAHIIHRDLKPANVLIAEHDSVAHPKLLDFGIAKLMSEPGVTRPGATLGTVAYMAPEQTRAAPVDRRADIYALGVIVYQMVTGGALPYDATDGALYHEQMTRPPIDPRSRCPAVMASIVAPILAAIHVDAQHRPSTAGALAVTLARELVGVQPDGMAILTARAPQLAAQAKLKVTLRAPGLEPPRGKVSAPWSYEYGPTLGRGGFGEVVRGIKVGEDGFVLPVAIKRILPEHAKTPEFVQMFHQEARIAALIQHENVVRVLDHGTDPSGQLVIVLEFIEGIDLEKLRRSGPIPLPILIHIFREVLEGLSYAHRLRPISKLSSAAEVAARGDARGIIHRDLSPDNVMLSWTGGVKIMDFGIAKLRDKTVAMGSTFLKGKPRYFSPEQANTAAAIDGRSDLFTIGSMLWELLTERALFDRDGLVETMAAVGMYQAPPPSLHNPVVPPQLDQVVLRLLQKYPGDRYQTAKEVIAALIDCRITSGSEKAELQELLATRFPEQVARDDAARNLLPTTATRATAGDGPAAPAAPWQRAGEPTTHRHAVGQPSAPSARAPRLWGAAVIGAALVVGTGLAMFVRSGRSSSADRSVESPQREHASPAIDRVAPVRPAALPPPVAAAASGPSAQTTATTIVVPTIALTVVTEPSGAMVQIESNATVIGAAASPLTIQAPRGAHVTIRAELAGFTSSERALDLSSLDRQLITLSLVPVAPVAIPATTRSIGRPEGPPTKPKVTKPARPQDDDGDGIMR